MNDNKAFIGAVNAAKLGLKVLPLTDYVRQEKGKDTWAKIPRIDHWPAHATTDGETIKKWATGDFAGTSSKSSKPCKHFGGSLEGFIVFDIDAPEAKESLQNIFAAAGCDGIVPTMTTRTGNGGYHFVYRQPEGYNLGNSVSKLAPKLDTRGGAGGYIVLPGTSNPVNGNEYTVVNEAAIAVLPQSVAEYVKSKVSPGKTTATVGKTIDRRSGSIPDTPSKIARATEYLLSKEGGVEGDGGEADAVCVGRKLADIGLSEERAILMAQAIYSPKCVPPWDDCPEQLAAKIHNGFAYRESEVGCEDPDLIVDAFKDAEIGEATEEDWKAFPFESMAKFAHTPPPPRETLIEGFMAHGKYLTLIYGAGGSGKSLMMMQMLRELSRGKNFLGMAPGKAAKDMHGALLSMEEPVDDVHFRFHTMTKWVSDDPFEDESVEPVWCNLRGLDAGVCKLEKNGRVVPGDGFARFVRVLKSLKSKVVVIDSLSRFFPGNENDRVAVTDFGRIVDRLVDMTGCHIILLAHTNKGGEFSGCSAWPAICRQMFVITAENIDGSTIYKMTAEKTNEGPRGVYVRYRFDNWHYTPVSDEEYERATAKAKQVKPSVEAGDAEDALLEMMGTKCEMRQTAAREALEEQGFSRKAATGAIESAVAGGRLLRECRYSADDNFHHKRVFLSVPPVPPADE